MKSIGSLVVLMMCGAACAPSHSKPEEVRFHLPSFQVQPGQETLQCFYATMPEAGDVFAWRYRTQQASGGHHLVVFTTTETAEQVPDGTLVDCSSPESMTNWRPLLTGLDKDGFEFPAGYAVRIPAHTRIVIQSHYIDASTAPIDADDEVTISFHREDAGLTLVGTSANTTLDFQIDPGATKTVTFDCPVTQPMNVFTFFGHMHEWGTRITIDAGAAAAPPNVYDVAWTPTDRDHPPLTNPGFDSPLRLNAGDVIRTTCSWNNTESTPLGFPREMCASVLWFFPADQSLVCTRPSN